MSTTTTHAVSDDQVRALHRVTATELHAIVRDGNEVAVLDVRELKPYSDGHILQAVSLPLSRLELRVAALVPRRSTRAVVVDNDDGELAQQAAAQLEEIGFSNIAVLDGGLAAWSAQGYEVFSGVNVLCKALGEFVEDLYETPAIDVTELDELVARGTDLVILDSRPLPEFQAVSIPGGVLCPGAELVYRAFDAVESPETLVVVNCAGRTRAIIGAQALINAGLPNRVVSLRNGTTAWSLAGLEPAHGEERAVPAPRPEGLAKAVEAAQRLEQRFVVRQIDRSTLQRFRDEAGDRSLYVFDVRTPDEYQAGHLPGSRSAPGGQLVQEFDSYVGTNHARVVLVDGADGVRAVITASWLVQLGLDDVYVHKNSFVGEQLEVGPEPVEVLGSPGLVDEVDVRVLEALVQSGEVVVVDLASSAGYYAGHIPGAWFAIRAGLRASVAKLPSAGSIVITSPDGVLARFAAGEIAGVLDRPVLALAGGTDAWTSAGLELEPGPGLLADEPIDLFRSPYETVDIAEFFQEYVRWGRQVVGQIERDGSVQFRSFA